MKQLLFAFISAFSFLAVGMDAPQSLLFWNGANPVATDIRRTYFYPVLCIQELGRLAQVNNQYLHEIGCIHLYRDVEFLKVKETIQDAWEYYHQGDWCVPQINICFMTIPQLANAFDVRSEQLVTHWIKKEILTSRPGRRSIDIDTLKKKADISDDNYCIMFKSSTKHYAMICVDGKDIRYVENTQNLKKVITIYSIDKHSKSLNQKELNTFIRDDIKESLVIILEKSLLLNDEIMEALRGQLSVCSNQSNSIIGGNCIQMLGLYRQSYQISEKERQRENQSLLEMQAIALNSIQSPRRTYHNVLPSSRPCIIQ